MEIFNISNLNFKYPNSKDNALENINFSVEEGDFIVLCGQTGCGKTTLLKMLKEQIKPHGEISGEILYYNEPIETISQERSSCEIGYVFQNPKSQIVTDTVWHELAFGLENMRLDNQVIRRRIGEIAAFFGIEKIFRQKTTELSGGQMQILNLASVMVMNPKVILLDEPTSQLDPIAASELIFTLKKINTELGLTVILAEHRLEDVFLIADKVLLMEEKRVLIYDTPKNTAKILKNIDKSHPMLKAMPSAVKIFSGLNGKGDVPITVKEARRFLNDYVKENVVQNPPVRQSYKKREISLSLDNVWFRYSKDSPDIMRSVTFDVYKGETYCILGGNGSGKTTTVNVACGLLKNYEGTIKINGKRLKDYQNIELYKNNVAVLPQDSLIVFVKETIREDFDEVCLVMGYDKDEHDRQIKELSEIFGIKELLDSHPYDLSGGQQQKCALVKLLLLKPQLIFLDEPTKGFDSFAKDGLLNIINNLKSKGITIVIVTHDVEFAAKAGDRCAMYFDGEIISQDIPEVFFSQNNYYTTAANRIAREKFPFAVTCSEVIYNATLNAKEENEV